VMLGPNITGRSGCGWDTNYSEAFSAKTAYSNKLDVGAHATFYTSDFDASRSSSIYSNNVTTVQPPALVFNYTIKY